MREVFGAIAGLSYSLAKLFVITAFIFADWNHQWVPNSWTAWFAMCVRVFLAIWLVINLFTGTKIYLEKDDDN